MLSEIKIVTQLTDYLICPTHWYSFLLNEVYCEILGLKIANKIMLHILVTFRGFVCVYFVTKVRFHA
jgi:hypothetical protein